MAIQQNAVLRMIAQLQDAFGRIFAGDEVDDERQALFELEGVLADVFRTRRELLFMRPEEMIEEFDPRVAAEVGRLFLAHSDLSRSQGLDEADQRSYRLAVQCLRGGLGEELGHTDKTSNDLMRELLRARRITSVLDAEQLSETWRDIFEIEARRQNYAQAEDALFHAIDLADDPTDHVKRGVRFYETLLKLTDELLEEGGLPRVEVQEALQELQNGV